MVLQDVRRFDTNSDYNAYQRAIVEGEIRHIARCYRTMASNPARFFRVEVQIRASTHSAIMSEHAQVVYTCHSRVLRHGGRWARTEKAVSMSVPVYNESQTGQPAATCKVLAYKNGLGRFT